MATMNFSSIDTKTLNTMYNDARQKRETLKENRKAFIQDMMNQIEVFMQGMFGKSVKVTKLDTSLQCSSRITFSFDNSRNSSLAIDFRENKETGKFEAEINNSFTYINFNLTSDTNTSTTKIDVIYCIVKNIDRVKDILLDKLEYTYNTLKKFRDEDKELCTKNFRLFKEINNRLFKLFKEINNRQFIENDEEIWKFIKNNEKFQKKYVIVKHTKENTYVMHNGQNPVHILSEPDTKTTLKKEHYLSDNEEIVKVSELSMLLH